MDNVLVEVRFIYRGDEGGTALLPGVPEVGEIIRASSSGVCDPGLELPDDRYKVIKREWEFRRNPMPGQPAKGFVWVYLRRIKRKG